MRILLTTDSFPPNCGGSGWSTYELACGLRERGHLISIVQPRPRQDADGRRQYDGFIVDEVAAAAPPVPFVRNYFKNERLWAQLSEYLGAYLRRSPADVVHAQHVLTTVPSVSAAHAVNVPVVATVRDYWPVCYWSDLIVDFDADHLCDACTIANMRRCLHGRVGAAGTLALPLIPYMRANLSRKREGLGHADAVIAVSSVIAADLKARAPELAATDVRQIPNPVNVAAIRRAAGDAPRPIAEPYALYVGKLERNKGAGHLVDVMTYVGRNVGRNFSSGAAGRSEVGRNFSSGEAGRNVSSEVGRNFSSGTATDAPPLIVVGDGALREPLESQAAAANLDVRIQGWLARDRVLAWMRHASVLVFPSFGPESLSRVLLEAAALGVPIAAMNTGGTRDIVIHEQTGLMSTSVDGLSRDVARLLTDGQLATRLGENARRHVEQTFDTSVVVERIERLYLDLLERRGARG